MPAEETLPGLALFLARNDKVEEPVPVTSAGLKVALTPWGNLEIDSDMVLFPFNPLSFTSVVLVGSYLSPVFLLFQPAGFWSLHCEIHYLIVVVNRPPEWLPNKETPG